MKTKRDVEVFSLQRPGSDTKVEWTMAQHDQALAVVKAMFAIRRVVRVEPSKYGTGIVLKATRS